MDHRALEGVHWDDGGASTFGASAAVAASYDDDCVDLVRIEEFEEGDEPLVGITIPSGPAEHLLVTIKEVDHLLTFFERSALALDVRKEVQDVRDRPQQDQMIGVPDLVAFGCGDGVIGRQTPKELKGLALKEFVLRADPMKRGIRHGSSLAIQD